MFVTTETKWSCDKENEINSQNFKIWDWEFERIGSVWGGGLKLKYRLPRRTLRYSLFRYFSRMMYRLAMHNVTVRRKDRHTTNQQNKAYINIINHGSRGNS